MSGGSGLDQCHPRWWHLQLHAHHACSACNKLSLVPVDPEQLDTDLPNNMNRKAYGKRVSRNGGAATVNPAAKASKDAAAASIDTATGRDARGIFGKANGGLRPRAGVNGHINGAVAINGHSLSHAI